MRGRGWLVAILAFSVFFARVDSVFGQAGLSSAQLNGTVLDEKGGSVANASITLRETETNSTYPAKSGTSGFYVIPNLPPGHYELKVSYAGFGNYTQTGIELRVGQVATIDVTLKIASMGEQVTVNTEVQAIEPSKTEISQVIEAQQIGSLPISGRLFTDFALLTPGVSTSRTSLGTTFTEYEATQISFGGMRSFSNEVTVDGADFVNTISGVQRSTPPQESVQEFRVVNNSFGAEYGRALGGIVNIVTKSGTNDFHGSVYDYLQNGAADSRSLLQPAPLPHTLRQNQFGGTLGGPISKDKTFFFVNYEGKRRAESPTYPPDLVNNLTLIDTAKRYLGLAPEGCLAPLAACAGSDASYLQSFLKTVNNDYGFARFDRVLSANNRLSVRYNVEDARDTGELVGQTLDGGGTGVPSGGRNLFIRDQSLVGTLDSSLRPNLINTVLVQYARRHYNFPGATGQPDLSVLNDLEFGHNFGTYDSIYESRVEGADSVAWVKGNHVLKFGFDGNYVWGQTHFPGFTPARLLIPTGVGPSGTAADCLAAFANFVNLPGGPPLAAANNCPVAGLNGVVVTYLGIAVPRDPTFAGGSPLNDLPGNALDTATWANAFPPQLYSHYAYDLQHGYWGLFAQDQWRVTPKLVLNYGLRWDYESGLGDTLKSYYNGWQPRVGLAYSPNSKTVLRAGFGMFDDRYNLTFFFTPNNQKTVAGFLCNPPTPACTAAGISAQKLPMINSGAPNGGWQLIVAVPGPGPTPAQQAKNVLTNGNYVGTAADPASLSGTCFTTGACGIGAGGMDRNVNRIPYAEQASLEIDRQIGAGLTVDVGYLFVAAHRLVRGNNINVPCPVGTTKAASQVADPLPEAVLGLLNPDGTLTSCTGTPTLQPAGTPIAGLGPWFAGALGSGLQTISGGLLDYNNGVANAVYHGGTLTVMERVKYFNLTANYTYSHTIDNGNFTTFINLPENQFDYVAERANSNQDARHHFVANFTATAPQNSFARNFVFSSIITLQSGRPFTIFSGSNTFNDLAGGNTDRVGGAPVAGHCSSADHCTTTVPRNTYVGDPLRAWDLRLSRSFRFREKLKLDLSVDAFNTLNRSNVDEVTSIYGSPVFCGGAIPKSYRDATSRAIQGGTVGCSAPGPYVTLAGNTVFVPPVPNNTFGLPRTMLNPRQLQFAMKFSF